MTSNPTDPISNAEAEGVPTESLSKSKLKKIQKRQRVEAVRATRKAEAKHRKQAESQVRQVELQRRLEQFSTEEREAWVARRQAVRQERKSQDAEKKSRLQQAQQHGQQVILDLSFGDLMTETEMKSLAQQLIYCYSANCKCTAPCHLTLTGFQGRIADQLTAQSPGHTQWTVTKHAAAWHEVYKDRKETLVYLTADAADELSELDPSTAYIIGGLVDRNRYKNICQDRALEQGVRTARLPIREHMQMTGTHVLTVNQVVSLLLEFQEGRDWPEALLKILPGRKHASQQQAHDAGHAGAADAVAAGPDSVLPADSALRKRKLESSSSDADGGGP